MLGFLVDIADLAGAPGASRPIVLQAPIPGLGVTLAWIDEGEPLQINLVADRVKEGIEVSGTVAGTMMLCCSRCLVEYPSQFERELSEMYYFNLEAAGGKEGYEVAGTTIDLEPMLRDVIVLALPVNPLHDPECAGLCPVCGADRNLADCGHRRSSEDLRWAPLKTMLAGQVLAEEDE